MMCFGLSKVPYRAVVSLVLYLFLSGSPWGSEGGRGKKSHVRSSHTWSVSSSSFLSRYFELAVEGLEENSYLEFVTNRAVKSVYQFRREIPFCLFCLLCADCLAANELQR